MQKDIKKMFENYIGVKANLSANHHDKFQKKLMKEMHLNKSRFQIYKWVSIAASVLLIVSLAYSFYTKDPVEIKTPNENIIRLGSISPELNTIENYYINSIHLELSELEMTDENKELLDGYLSKIEELTKEYTLLTKELNTKGVNDKTIDALISNLQLRLQLLQRLKKKLNSLKQLNTKENEIQTV